MLALRYCLTELSFRTKIGNSYWREAKVPGEITTFAQAAEDDGSVFGCQHFDCTTTSSNEVSDLIVFFLRDDYRQQHSILWQIWHIPRSNSVEIWKNGKIVFVFALLLATWLAFAFGSFCSIKVLIAKNRILILFFASWAKVLTSSDTFCSLQYNFQVKIYKPY